MALVIKLCFMLLLIVPCRNDCMHRSGPYKAEQESYLDCTGSRDHEITMNAKINRRDPNNCSVRDICISFNVILKFDLNNDYEILRTHYCKDSVGLWKFFRSQGPMKACDLPSWWMYSVQTLTNASSPCPLQKGSYSIDCRKVPQSQRETELHFYGEYKTIKHYYRNGSLAGCMERKEKILPIAN